MEQNKLQTLASSMTPIMVAFGDNYVLSLNATDAAGKAGCTGKNLTQIGAQLLHHPKVEAYIQELRRYQREKMGITQDRVLQEYARIAFADPRKMFNENGAIIPITEMDDDTAAAVGQISTKEIIEKDGRTSVYVGEAKQIKTHSKVAALDALGRHLGLNEKDNQQKQSNVVIVNGDEAKEIWKSLNEEF